MPIVIPEIVKQLSHFILSSNWKQKLDTLDAFLAEVSADQAASTSEDGINPHAWWNELDFATFPDRDVRRSTFFLNSFVTCHFCSMTVIGTARSG
jgi:hypothetical protein